MPITKPGTHRITAVADVTWLRLALIRDGNKLVETPEALGGLPSSEPRWDYTNVEAVTDLVPANGTLVVKIDRSFCWLNELSEDAAWRRRDISKVIIHGQYDPSNKTTVQSTIDCNETGATVHIVSGDYGRSIGDFLVDNAGFQSPQDYAHERLNDAVICNFDEVLVVGDEHTFLDFNPKFTPLCVSYETLNQLSD
jgi:hypothetical protein